MDGDQTTKKKPGAPINNRGGRQEPGSGIPGWLARSGVYRRVPLAVRGRLDAAILLRPTDCPTLEAIAAKFKLAERYGISRAALRAYAGKLEQLVRPVAAGQVLAGVLGCLPASYRRQLAAGSEVMLLSRLAQTLSDAKPSTLAVADLARLAVMLKTLRQASSKNENRKERRSPDRARASSGSPPDPATAGPDRMAEAVRALYGLSWPTKQQT